MTRLKILFLFISIFVVRWVTLPSPLPVLWTSESEVGYTVTVLSEPEYSDSRTIIRSGIWYISLRGYTKIISGSRVKFQGIVEPKIVLGKVTQIKMMDPKFEIVGDDSTCVGCRLMINLGRWRERWVGILERVLPEPMASLAAGILLGVKGQMPQDFYQSLVSTGTLHIVAASGYNVSIVAAVIMQTMMTIVSRGLAIGIGTVGIIFYVLIAGGSASVVRAGIMGSLTLIAYYFGRPAEAKRLLWLAAGVMLLINPLLIFDIGFELSFGATIGILYLLPWLQTIDSRLQKPVVIKAILANYLYPTLAATIATLPIILWYFGRISWISPLVNILILPVVPLVMGMSAIVIGVGMIAPLLGQVVGWLAYVPLIWIVGVIRLWG